MKAYGIPVQSVTWKPASAPQSTPAATAANAAVAAALASNNLATTAATIFKAAQLGDKVVVTTTTSSSSSSPSSSNPSPVAALVTPARLLSDLKPDASALEPCQLSSKQLEDLMDDDDCSGPVSNGDPMLSSPHLSPHGPLSSAAAAVVVAAANRSPSGYSGANSDVAGPLSPATSAADSMDLGSGSA